MRSFTAFLITIIALVACTTQDVCDSDLKASAVASLYTTRNGVPTDTIISGFSLYGIRENLPDSLLYDSANVSKLQLPLDPNHNKSSFVISIREQSDTIHIHHESTLYLVSYTCGFAHNYNIQSIDHTGHIIQLIEPVNEFVLAEETNEKEHFRIYF
ncbi:MAG: hypothetical protein JXR52_08910 [Bacteroidales bacterium]|nr:hypothetical protein [Bacteroidales bacterium]MBN2698933.1 hypothetical protein [Bacteroidales bacterium]